ncbi:hypothetical protein BDV06DRAFT_191338 [Aspergillus oleicola]
MSMACVLIGSLIPNILVIARAIRKRKYVVQPGENLLGPSSLHSSASATPTQVTTFPMRCRGCTDRPGHRSICHCCSIDFSIAHL